MRLARRFSIVAAILAMFAAIVAAPGQASTVTIGSTQTSNVIPTSFGATGASTVTILALGTPGAIVASPVDGMVIRWRMTDASGGPFYLRVLRPAAGQFLGAGTSAPAVPAGGGTQTFATSLPIRRGDLIGLNTSTKTDEIGAIPNPASTIAAWTTPLPDGASAPPTASASGAEFVFSADVQPTPAVTLASPASGSISGGTTVAIAGTDLAGATSVLFGDVPAAIFPGNTDSAITAVAPPAKKPGPVSITVVTNAGRSAAAPRATFTYTACVVPKLKGKTRRAARKRLRKAGCRLGKVRGRGKRVARQSAKKGKILPPGRKVNVKLH